MESQKITTAPLPELCMRALSLSELQPTPKRKILQLPKQRKLARKTYTHQNKPQSLTVVPPVQMQSKFFLPRFTTTKEPSASGRGHSITSDYAVKVKHAVKHSYSSY